MKHMRFRVRATDLTPGGALRSGDAEAIQNLLKVERGFALVPSDSCYAFSAVPTGLTMSRRINRVLDRRREPISLAFDGVPRAGQWVKLSPLARRLFDKLTPGPLTVVCPLGLVEPSIADDALAVPDRTLGVRIPDSVGRTRFPSDRNREPTRSASV